MPLFAPKRSSRGAHPRRHSILGRALGFVVRPRGRALALAVLPLGRALGFAVLTLLAILPLPSCEGGRIFGGRVAVSDTRFALGSFLQLILVTDKQETEKTKQAIDKAYEIVKGFESRVDYRVEGGALFTFNGGTTLLESEDEMLFALVREALAAAEYTGGFFDPTILPLVRLWGFDSDSPRLPKKEEIAAALKLVGFRNVELREDRIVKPREVQIDLSGIAQGKAVDLVRDFLKSEGYKDFLVNASGDIYVSGRNAERKKWRVAIQDPVRQDRYIGIVDKSDVAVVTSGDYERFFTEGGRRYSHLMNPFTGYPPSDLKSVTVLALDTVTADFLSTAVFVMGSAKGLEFLIRNGIDGYLVFQSGEKVESASTPGFWK
jgi:thiamine biosynthesis lipoprotein